MINALLAACLLLGPPALAAANEFPMLAELVGQPQVLLDGIEPWVPAETGQELPPFSQVKAGRGSAVIVFPDGSKVRLSRGGTLTIDRASPSNIAVSLGLGRLEAWVSSRLRSRIFQVRTPSAVASVRGTVFVAAVGSDRKTVFDLFSGRLAVVDNFGQQKLIGPGTRIEASHNGLSAPGKVSGSAPAEPRGDFKPLKGQRKRSQAGRRAAVQPPDDETQPEETLSEPEPLPDPNPVQETQTSVSPSSP